MSKKAHLSKRQFPYRRLGRAMFKARKTIKSTFSALAMAGAIGSVRSTVERWESGEIKPPLDQLEEYCAVLRRKEVPERAILAILMEAYPKRYQKRTNPIERLNIERDRIDELSIAVMPFDDFG